MRVSLLSTFGAIALAACGASSSDAGYAGAIADAAQAGTLGSAVPGLTGEMDQRDATPRRFVVSVDCPAGAASAACGAEAAVRASAWLNATGAPPEDLIVNVDLPAGGIGFQLMGPVASDAELSQLTETEALARFAWNGGSHSGQDAAATYCMAGHDSDQFCQRLAAEACNPLAPPKMSEFCRAQKADG